MKSSELSISAVLEEQATALFLSVDGFVSLNIMETETKVAVEDPKIDLFEGDDEFEEFQINQEWDEKEEGKEATQQWEDDWDDDDVNDDFSLQLRRELENNSEKS